MQTSVMKSDMVLRMSCLIAQDNPSKNKPELKRADFDLPVPIHLPATLYSGQSFRWQCMPEGYINCIEGNAVLVRSTAEGIHITSHGDAGLTYWKLYFDLERDYAFVGEQFPDDVFIQRALSQYDGLRVLNQPVWETLCGFILSANNNTRRISRIMHQLSAALGEERNIAGYPVFSFPQPEALLEAGEARLRALGTGYRAPYLLDAARRVCEGMDLSRLAEMSYEEAQTELIRIKGVGDKVAQCVLLFSCGFSQAFPVDVWVKRIMQQLYHAEGRERDIKAFGQQRFGAMAGIVQQLLFHGAREGLY